MIALYDIRVLFFFFSPSLFVDNSLTKFSQREISLEKLLRRFVPRRFVPRFSGHFYYETSLNGSRIRTSSIYTFHLFLFFFTFHREIRLIEEEIVFMLVNFHAILRKFVESCSRKKNNKRTWKDITYATNHWRGETLGYWAQFLPCRAATRPTQHRLLAFKFSRELALRHREINLFAVQFCESVIKQLYSFELSGRSFSNCFRNCISHFSSHLSFFFLFFFYFRILHVRYLDGRLSLKASTLSLVYFISNFHSLDISASFFKRLRSNRFKRLPRPSRSPPQSPLLSPVP